jgi:CubicO group peptidase (beta-lactamase class C family)
MKANAEAPNRLEDSILADRLNQVIDRALAENRIVGTDILVARNGRVVFARAAGFADRENGRPVHNDTIFRLASMTKPIVSAAALGLVEQGKVRLEDPVTRWLPDFRPALPEGHRPTINVRHLLTHTAGLTYGFKSPADSSYHRAQISDGLEQPGLSIEENLRRLASVPLLYPPGTIWNYSLAIDVLGEVIARASSASLPKVIEQLVTAPLGMKDTTFSVTDPIRLATAYADADPQPVRMNDPHLVRNEDELITFSPCRAFDPNSYPSGGAGMIGTAQDYLGFLEAVRTRSNPILKPESIERMITNAIPDTPAPLLDPGWTFGFGFGVLEDPAPTDSPMNPGTFGWGGVYGNKFWVDPVAQLSVVILTNTAVAGMTGDFPDSVARAIYGARA